MSKLQRFRAAGFRSIRRVDLELSDLNVLIGANGSGKSNFIGILRLLNDLVEERLQVSVATAGGANALLHFGRKQTSRLEIDLEFGMNGYMCVLVPTADDNLVFESEQWSFQGEGHSKPYFEGNGAGQRESALRAAAGKPGVARFVRRALESWKVYHFHDTSPSAGLKQLGPIDDNTRLRADASNLAAFLYYLQESSPNDYANVVNASRLAAPFLRDLSLRPSPTSPGKIKLEWLHRGSDAYFDASSLSDGTIRFLCLATLLLQPNLPSVVLLDEPELGLHPAAIGTLAGLLRSASKRTQVIVSTQSVTLVNQLAPEDLVIAERENEASVFRRFSSGEIASWMDEYSLGELWEKNVLGGRP